LSRTRAGRLGSDEGRVVWRTGLFMRTLPLETGAGGRDMRTDGILLGEHREGTDGHTSGAAEHGYPCRGTSCGHLAPGAWEPGNEGMFVREGCASAHRPSAGGHEQGSVPWAAELGTCATQRGRSRTAGRRRATDLGRWVTEPERSSVGPPFHATSGRDVRPRARALATGVLVAGNRGREVGARPRSRGVGRSP
jgi:hypothetical protein